jgi:hypothetical protein
MVAILEDKQLQEFCSKIINFPTFYPRTVAFCHFLDILD